ncbi:hypothetical protein Bca52824_042155 [Brassica carinata]|uniref:Uncharacterized protein n=1 Tax=Brassica carinata TaxID=52824 RepID=A0A8X7UZG6_BRACI|nr:hypothetical protein Bca52824_042155 [Brassica carinata]
MGIRDISDPYSTISQGLAQSYEEYVEIHSRCMRQLGLPVRPGNHLGQQTHGFWAKSGLCTLVRRTNTYSKRVTTWAQLASSRLLERRLQCTASLSSRKRTSRSPKSGKYTLSTKERCGTRVWRKYIDDLKDPGPSGKSYSLSGIYGCCQEQKRNA